MHTRGHIAGLDGLRAIAVLLVMATHSHWDWAAGGWLGVDRIDGVAAASSQRVQLDG